ncbi:LysE family translocator [Burkholderia sp. S171]|uniref:LysE family translocator n=1 Tax=Burkholderia sp. S171 TaxID=1641860 RepID=UPI00131CB552|nr:LysE family translocator [Burkholderia sp. S171]
MPSFQTLLPFFGISVVLGLTPGPDNLFVLLQSATRGARSGMVIVLGLCTGLIVHTLVVAVGLGALLVASSVAFTVLKIAGAVYLVFLAWRAWRAPVSTTPGKIANADAAGLYRGGLIMNLGNPKVVIFFLAFLPQFVSAQRGHIPLQIIVLGMTFICASFIAFGVIAIASGIGGRMLLGSTRAQRALNRFSGLVFVALAAKLASSRV